MTKSMKQNFKFVNVSGGAYHDITTQCTESDVFFSVTTPSGLGASI
jgi:hypothetical protein